MTCTIRPSLTVAWTLVLLVAIVVLILVEEGSPSEGTTATNLRSPSNNNDDKNNNMQDYSFQNKGSALLLWSDEFDGDELNQEYWTCDSIKTFQQDAYDDDQVHNIDNFPLDPIGTDLDYYDPHAISVKDGMLTISTRQVINAGVPFVSGRIKTQDKILFQYGTMEARIRIRSSCKQGLDVCVSAMNLSPSFWTRGSGSTSYGLLPTKGQVDIFSAALPRTLTRRRIRGMSKSLDDGTRRLTSNNNLKLEAIDMDTAMEDELSDRHPWMGHSGASWIATRTPTNDDGTGAHQHVIKKSFHDDFPIENWMDQDFHIYKFDWTPTRMATYIDDELVWEMDITDGSCGEDDCQDFHRPHYLLLAISVLDDNNAPSSSWTSSSSTSSSSTMDLSVDYVRLFDNGFVNLSRFP